jgi:AcrR family transcriptional regulator
MSSKPDLSVERRKQILEAAESVFARLGINRARMDDIVAEAGLSKGTLYWYFKSKDAIIAALIERVFAGEMREAEELVSADGSASERLSIFMRPAVHEIRRFENLMSLGYEFVALASRRSVVRETIRGYYRRYHRILSQIIQQGLDSGEFGPLDPDDAALAAIGLVEGIALLWFVDPELVNWDTLEHNALKVLLDGFRRRAT